MEHSYWSNKTQVNANTFHFVFMFYVIVEMLGLFVNLIVLYYLVIVKVKKKAETYFLINLAIADLVLLIGVIPMNLISSLNKKWMFGSIGNLNSQYLIVASLYIYQQQQKGCQIDGFLGGIFGFTSIMTIMFMTIERFIVIRNPFTVIIYNKKATLCCILIAWLYSIFWMTLVISKNGFYLEGILISCTFDYLSRDFHSRFLMMGMFIGGFLVPLLVIILFYFLIWFLLKQNSKFDKFLFFSNIKLASERSLSRNSKSRHNKDDSQNTKKYNLFIQKEVSVAKRIIIMVISFCVAWLPYTIFILYGQFGNDIQDYVTPYTTSLPAVFAKSSSIYNPIIYVLTNNDCKLYFTRRVSRKKSTFRNNEIKVPGVANYKAVQV